MSVLQKKHLTNIDLLRGIASLMVVFFHFTEYLPDTNFLKFISQNGWLGVQVFFVISGFIIPYSLYQSKYKIKNFFAFVAKRCIRIEPPYLITLLLIIINLVVFNWYWNHTESLNWSQALLHIFYLPQFFGYQWYNPIFWTLAQEFQFYIAMALFFPLLNSSKKWIKYMVILAFILPFFIFQDGRLITNNTSLFLMGIITFLYFTKQFNLLEFLVFIVANITYMYFFQFNDNYNVTIITTLTVLAILFLKSDTKIGTFGGKISYSLYLTHGLIGGNFLLFTINRNFVGNSEIIKTILVFIAIGMSVVFAYFFYKWIEKPSQALSKKIKYT